MFAAKEKTFSPSSRSTFTWSPRGTYVQAAATHERQPPTMNDVQPVVSRFTQNDFRARKSEKSPIGSTVKTRSKTPWQSQHSAEKTLGENVVHLRRSHWTNDMSQYRAYFVPRGVDPLGLQTSQECFESCMANPPLVLRSSQIREYCAGKCQFSPPTEVLHPFSLDNVMNLEPSDRLADPTPSYGSAITSHPAFAPFDQRFKPYVVDYNTLDPSYNCHSLAWHGGNGDKDGDDCEVPVAPLPRWDNSPVDDFGSANLLSRGTTPMPGDIVVYIDDYNLNGVLDPWEASHSATVVTVESGLITVVHSKPGQAEETNHHVNDPLVIRLLGYPSCIFRK